MKTQEQKEKYNEYMRLWYADKVANDPDWKKKKREQTKKSVDRHYKKVGYNNSTQKKYYHKNKTNPEFMDKSRELKGQSYYRNQEKNILYKAKTRSKECGVPFNIEVEDIKIPEVCPVFNVPFLRHKGHSRLSSISIDRIIPALGYVKGNIQVLSLKANIMKSNATPEELLMFADWVYKTYKEPIQNGA